MPSVSAGSMTVLLVGLLACPFMLLGTGQARAACAETGDSHAPMSDTHMSCCSSATELLRLAPTDANSSRVLKSLAVALLNAEPTVTLPRPPAVRYDASVPATTSDPPLFIQHVSFLI